MFNVHRKSDSAAGNGSLDSAAGNGSLCYVCSCAFHQMSSCNARHSCLMYIGGGVGGGV